MQHSAMMVMDNSVRLSHDMNGWLSHMEPQIAYEKNKASQRLAHQPSMLLKFVPSVQLSDVLALIPAHEVYNGGTEHLSEQSQRLSYEPPKLLKCVPSVHLSID